MIFQKIDLTLNSSSKENVFTEDKGNRDRLWRFIETDVIIRKQSSGERIESSVYPTGTKPPIKVLQNNLSSYNMGPEFTVDVTVRYEEFHRENRNHYIFIAQMNEQKMVLAVLSEEKKISQEKLKKFMNLLELEDACVSSQTEISMYSWNSLLYGASQFNFVENDWDLPERFGLRALMNRHRRRIYFTEKFIPDYKNREDMLQDIGKHHFLSSMGNEIDRIFMGAKKPVKSGFGHPVHYLICSDDTYTREKMAGILLAALHKNKRIAAGRYCSYDLEENMSVPDEMSAALFRSCAGASMLINLPADEYEEHDFADFYLGLIKSVASMINEYRDRVLNVVCLPSQAVDLKSAFLEYCPDITFVVLEEQVLFGKDATKYLENLATCREIEPDEKLLQIVDDEDKAFSSVELGREFSAWYNRKLRTEYYPQYSGFDTRKKAISKEKPKGSAYRELTALIGLEDAKTMISKALDYYKARKVFELLAMDSQADGKDRSQAKLMIQKPSMHMIFTGNPGTAKTTVARLFAQIMKENGFLSVGNLVEVGRNDLVGKYVGWTAKIVKANFRKAKGGVLFIDEAYALLDEREGVFGDEAINTIVQEMENNRDDTIVIFAGYPDKMEDFISRNPGLRSRVSFHLNFPDYDTEELGQIAELMVAQRGMRLTAGAKGKLMKVFEAGRDLKDFGNGRFVRNLIEQALINQASRLVGEGLDGVSRRRAETLRAEDFDLETVAVKKSKRLIGFGRAV